jgi:hypothetical protein
VLIAREGREGTQAIKADPSVVGSSLISYAGDLGAGRRTAAGIRTAEPAAPGCMHTLLAQDRLMVDDDAAALAESSLIHAPGGIWGPLLRAMALVGLGYRDQARRAMDAVLAIEPTFLDEPAATFTRHASLTDEQIGALLRRLEAFRTPADS